MSEATERETQLVATFLDKVKALVPGVKIRFVERVVELGEPGLRVGLALPEGVSLLGDEAFTIDDMAEKFSEAQKYRVSANMTPVAGTGDLLTVASIEKFDYSEDAVIAVPALIAPVASIEAAPLVVKRTSTKSQNSSSDSGGRGGGTLLVDNSTAIALVVVALLLAVPTAWNYFRAPASVDPSPYLATSPGPNKGTEQPNTAAGPQTVEEQTREIEEDSAVLDSKMARLQMNLTVEGKKAEAEKIEKMREKVKAAMKDFGVTQYGDK